MKRIVRSLLVLSMPLALCTLLVPAASIAASAASQVPFQGTFPHEQDVISSTCALPTICAIFSGTGELRHLGRTTESGVASFNAVLFFTTGCSPETGTDTLTAANGDQVSLTFTGQVCATGPNSGQDTLTYTITGGTGRFAGASGTGSLLSRFILTSPTAGTSVSTFSGTISSPGSLP
jgi:hypothetical protein